MLRRITVLLLLAEPLLQAGVRASLTGEPDMRVLPESLDAQERADVLIADHASAVNIMHQRRALAGRPDQLLARLLIVAPQLREHAVRSALEQGVSGVLLSASPVASLLDAVRLLYRGGRYLCPELALQLYDHSLQNMLTNRQDEVLQLMVKGYSDKSIAHNLDIGVETVRTHVKAILSKLDARCRTEAAWIATERGLVHFPG